MCSLADVSRQEMPNYFHQSRCFMISLSHKFLFVLVQLSMPLLSQCRAYGWQNILVIWSSHKRLEMSPGLLKKHTILCPLKTSGDGPPPPAKQLPLVDTKGAGKSAHRPLGSLVACNYTNTIPMLCLVQMLTLDVCVVCRN